MLSDKGGHRAYIKIDWPGKRMVHHHSQSSDRHSGLKEKEKSTTLFVCLHKKCQKEESNLILFLSNGDIYQRRCIEQK